MYNRQFKVYNGQFEVCNRQFKVYNGQFEVYNRQFEVYNRQIKVSKLKNKKYLRVINTHPYFIVFQCLIIFLSDTNFPQNITFDPLVSKEEMTIGDDLGPIICQSDCTDCSYVWLTPVGNISGQVLMRNNMTEVDFGMYSCVVLNPSYNNASIPCRQQKSFNVFQSNYFLNIVCI